MRARAPTITTRYAAMASIFWCWMNTPPSLAKAWTEVLRPALADRQGRALFIGTPRGFNHFHELVESATTQPDWKAFQFTTAEGGNVTLAARV